MKHFGLTGYPVKGSLSPALFNAGYGGRYTYDLIEEPCFETAFKRFTDSYDGINVTAPFKEQALAKADIIDPVCAKIGATNLLVKTTEGIAAYNADYTGVIRSIIESVIPGSKDTDDIPMLLRSRFGRQPRALVVGCGGAGKAAAVAAADMGMATTLMNRTVSRAEGIASALPGYRFTVRPTEDFTGTFLQSDIIIYTLPGRIDYLDDILSIRPADDASGKSAAKFILEANYKHPSFDSTAIQAVTAAFPGTQYISGLRWLLHQAAGGYEHFTGEKPDFQAMEKTIHALSV